MALPSERRQALLDLLVDLVHLCLQHRLLHVLQREEDQVVPASKERSINRRHVYANK